MGGEGKGRDINDEQNTPSHPHLPTRASHPEPTQYTKRACVRREGQGGINTTMGSEGMKTVGRNIRRAWGLMISSCGAAAASTRGARTAAVIALRTRSRRRLVVGDLIISGEQKRGRFHTAKCHSIIHENKSRQLENASFTRNAASSSVIEGANKAEVQGVAIKKCPPGISQVLTLIVTPLDLFAFVCSFGVIISHSRFQHSKTSQKIQKVV